MILSGEKKEEYREIKPYWAKRLLYKIEFPWGGYMSAWKDIVNGDYECRGWQNTTGQAPIWENFDTITFRNGYSSNAPEMTVKFRGLYIGTGKTKWGAEDGKKYFVIQLGEIISTKNIKN